MTRLAEPIIVFVRPQAAGNIGALARVMSNFGVQELRLTENDPGVGRDPNDPYMRMDWALAKRGEKILSEARWYKNLASALEGVHLAIGSSGRAVEFKRGYARPHLAPHEAFQAVQSWHDSAEKSGESFRWAFVLGPEDDGLSDFEAALCQKLIQLPTRDLNPSLNVAMAAGCVLYHWHLVNLGIAPLGQVTDTGAFLAPNRAERLRSTEAGREGNATFEHKEDFLDYLMETVSKTQFLKYPDQESVKARVRRWLQFASIPIGELLFAFEIVYHLKSWGTGKFEERHFLKSQKKK